MKRSHAIALGATGIILAGAWLGSGKGEGVSDAAIYADISECIRGGALNREQCEGQFAEAEKNHVSAAPKFANAGECESQYGAGQCKPASFNGASVFVPAMVGMLVANHLTNRRQAQALLPPQRGIPTCPPGQTPESMPGCVAPRAATSSSSSSSSGSGWRSYSTASGHSVSRNESAGQTGVKVPSQAAFAPPPRNTLGAVAPRPSSVTSTRSSSSGAASGTVSRGGFGSTARSTSSSSSS
jgi:hypothetical protein